MKVGKFDKNEKHVLCSVSAFRLPGGDSHLGPAKREGGQSSATEVTPAQAEEAAGGVDSREGCGDGAL